MTSLKTSVPGTGVFGSRGAPKPTSASVAGAEVFGSPGAPKQIAMHAWSDRLATILNHRIARSLFLTLYYLAILAGLVWLYGKGEFSTPAFIYQGF
jgi:hypothetical protein